MRAQTATEYLVLLAIVIVIALLVLAIMGGIPGIGNQSDNFIKDAEFEQKDIALRDYALTNSL